MCKQTHMYQIYAQAAPEMASAFVMLFSFAGDKYTFKKSHTHSHTHTHRHRHRHSQHLNGKRVHDALLIRRRERRENGHVEDSKIQDREQVRQSLHQEALARVRVVEVA